MLKETVPTRNISWTPCILWTVSASFSGWDLATKLSYNSVFINFNAKWENYVKIQKYHDIVDPKIDDFYAYF